jgi:hypothetical protein
MHEIAMNMTSAHTVKHFVCMARLMIPCFLKKVFFIIGPAGLPRSIAAILLSLCIYATASCQTTADQNIRLKNTIILNIDTTLDSIIFSGFSLALASQLTRDLSSAGYSIKPLPRPGSVLTMGDSSALVLTVRGGAAPGPEPLLQATAVPLSAWISMAADSAYQPLTVLPCPRADTAAAPLLVANKIAENLRSRFICRLTVNSVPPHAEVKSAAGLHGVCPAEWDIAFGIIDITARKKGYLPQTVRLHLSETRNPDTATITLVKRMPYHSAAFIPAIAFAAVSAALYGCEYYYYQKYRRLSENDLKNNPDAFGATFGIAQTCEYGAGISLGLAGALFVVTFFW